MTAKAARNRRSKTSVSLTLAAVATPYPSMQARCSHERSHEARLSEAASLERLPEKQGASRGAPFRLHRRRSHMEWLWPYFSYWFGEWLPKTLATYQTLIASVIALCAVVGGAMLNARFNRKQQDRIRHQDAVALAAMF